MTLSSLLLLIALCAIGSAFFSGAEIAVLSARRARLETLAEEGRRDARVAIGLLENAPRTITGILVGTNLCNVGASSLATALAVGLIGDRGPLVATAIVTPVFLIGAEILPKALFRSRPTSLLRMSAGPLRVTGLLLAPLVVVATGAARVVLAAIGVRGTADSPVFRREDLENLFSFGEVRREEGETSVGGGGDATLRMAAKALDLGERLVGDAMVPLPEDRRLPAGASVADAIERFREARGRYLAAMDEEGRVEGFVAAKVLLGAPGEAPVSRYVHPAVLFHPDDPLDDLMQGFRRHQHAVGLVRDRDGRTLGVVTPEDVFEEVVGDMPATSGRQPPTPARPAEPTD